MTSDSKSAGSENEGEGSRTAAKDYNERTKQFVDSGRVEQGAQDAKKALDGPEGESLRKAEQEGKKHSHGEDPAVRRN